MDLFDLHCDTATELYDDGGTLASSARQISLNTISSFEKYAQVFAVFSKPGLTDDACYDRFFRVKDHFFSSNGVKPTISRLGIESDERIKCILSVEDARLLSSDINRLDALYDSGVRVITPLWAGVTCIGGSFDTDAGLSDFGKLVINRSLELGIIPDISHASVRSADEIMSIAEEFSAPVIASHSDSFKICPHPRNIDDGAAKRVKNSGGVIGICLHAPHLSDKSPDCETVFRHIDHLVSVTDEDTVCLGCDFDGTSELPYPINCQRDLYALVDTLYSHGYGNDHIRKLFYENAFGFFRKNLGVKRKAK